MRRRMTWCLVPNALFVVIALHYAASLWARSGTVGFTAITLAVGRFGEIDLPSPNLKPVRSKGDLWEAWQKTNGPSDLYVQSNVWQPGGSTGWHTHLGHSLIIVTAGVLTEYDGHDPKCKPSVYTQGMGFVDPGGDHLHIIRNEGPVEARTIAVQLVPAEAMQRIDAEDPGNCHFR